MAEEEAPPCRCGKPAVLDVNISAGPPLTTYSVRLPARRIELNFQAVACRDCAFEAAHAVLKFLEEQKK